MDENLPAEKAQTAVTNDGGDNPRLVILDPTMNENEVDFGQG